MICILKALSIAVLLGLQILTASAQGLTPNPCRIEGSCSSRLQEIWQSYEEALPLRKQTSEGLYSGACYQKAFDDGGQTPFYAMTLIKKYRNQLYFGGKFNLRASANPYEKLSEADVEGFFPKLYSKKNRLKLERDFGFIDLNPKHSPIWHYYLRSQPDSGDLLVIGFWGTSRQVFCRLTAHS